MRDDAAASEAPIVPPPSYDEPVVTRRELWSYYLYYNGDNGVGPLSYSMTLFHLLPRLQAMTPRARPGSSCLDADASGRCVLPWGSGTKAVSSVVLVANGASHDHDITTIGSAADYGTFGRCCSLFDHLVGQCAGSKAELPRQIAPSRWGLAMGLYMVGFISYGATLVFYAAIFPRLARNTQHTRNLRERTIANRISNISTVDSSNIGFIVTLGLNLSLLLPLQSNPNTNGYWVLTGIWWFIYQQPRPGPKLPRGESYLTVGWKQIWVALKQYKKLPYTFTYLFAFFLLADGLNTTGTLVAICQNDKFTFSFLQNTYLGLAQAITSTASTLGFCTKKMFIVTNVVTILIPLWGMIGMWTDKFGFHNVWEFWAYNVFFGLFGLSNRASSMIGPNVIQAIINKSGNNWDGFPFLFALCAAASLVIWFGVDVQKGRRAAVMWAAERRGLLLFECNTSQPVRYISKLKQVQGRDTAMAT
ncbi:MFS general substrate transporter [Lactarius pseudohatsudake]|nr:MFS general substrate transporter [Lactarius pseudohatsudake]